MGSRGFRNGICVVPISVLSEVNLINTFNPNLILMKSITGSAARRQCLLGVG